MTIGVAEVKTREHQGKPSPLIAGQAKVWAQTPKVPEGALRQRTKIAGEGAGGLGGGPAVPARMRGALTAPRP